MAFVALSRILIWAIRLGLLLLGFAIGFGVPYGVYLDWQLQKGMDATRWQAPTRSYARPLELRNGLQIQRERLEFELREAGLRPGSGSQNNTFERQQESWRLTTSGQTYQWRLDNNRVNALRNSKSAIASLVLPPAPTGLLSPAAGRDRDLVPLERVPGTLLVALQALEDRNFKHHHGVDFRGIARAAWANIRAGEVVQGASTLTQQLMRSLFLNRKQKYSRKLNEVMLALLAERRYDKSEILEAYLNEVFWGQHGNLPVHGVARASRYYFDAQVQALTLEQQALLVGMLRGPSYYNPWQYPERAKLRRNQVLNALYDTGVISQAQRKSLSELPLGIAANPVLESDATPAFAGLAREQLQRNVDRDALTTGSLRVITTMSQWHQRAAEAAVREMLPKIEQANNASELEAAMVVLNRRSGNLLASVGGRDTDYAGFNRALFARRPVGSIIKPVVFYAALLRPGQYTLASLLDNTVIQVPLEDGDVWEPANFSANEPKNLLLYQALSLSANRATARVGMEIGPQNVMRALQELGFQSDVAANPSLLLGAVEMTPLEVAQVFTTLASGGDARGVNAVDKVTDQGGSLLFQASRVNWEPPSAARYLVLRAMQETVNGGTARSLQNELVRAGGIAAKTGTSNGLRDSWFVAVTDDLVVVTWVGRDDNQEANVTGASGALRITGNFLRRAGFMPLADIAPPGIEAAMIDQQTGTVVGENCRSSIELPFLTGSLPVARRRCSDRRFWPFD